MDKLELMPVDSEEFIKSRIFTIRGVQAILDWDIAELYGVETRVLNQAVKRNIERFPDRFRFVLTREEMNGLITICDKLANKKHYPGTAAAFTEQGIAMLSAVLKSDTAVMVSIRIIDVFVAMRRTLATLAPILPRIEAVERRQLKQEEVQTRNEERFNAIFKAMDGGTFPEQKVFFEGKHYDAFSFARKLVKKAKKSIALVDGYCDEVTLDILAQKKGGVKVTLATAAKTPITLAAVEKFNKQNPTLEVRNVGAFHDRFMIIDDTELYHFGASLKDLGRQYCAVSKMDAMFIPSILQRI